MAYLVDIRLDTGQYLHSERYRVRAVAGATARDMALRVMVTRAEILDTATGEVLLHFTSATVRDWAERIDRGLRPGGLGGVRLA